MATTSKNSFNIEVSAFGNATDLVDWGTESSWVFPLLMLNLETVDVLKVHAERLSKLRDQALDNFEMCVSKLSQRPKATMDELELLRSGMGAFDEAVRIANPSVSGKDSNRSLREALWESLETEAMAMEPARKALDKEVSTYLAQLESTPTKRIEQAQTHLEEALAEASQERAHLIRESRRLLRETMSVDGTTLAPIFWAEIGWMNWQASTSEAESLEWFGTVLKNVDGVKGIGMAICARLYAYWQSKAGNLNEAYRWSRVAADLWPCVGTFHERARYSMTGATPEVAKRELVAFIKKSPL